METRRNKRIKITYKDIGKIKWIEYENAILNFSGDFILVDTLNTIVVWPLKTIISIEKKD
jgi:hypothetical protein